MNKEIADKILKVAKNPMSATAIAQMVGKSKGHMIAEELNTLVENGKLIADDSGKFTTYKVAKTSNHVTVSRPETATDVKNTQVVDKVENNAERVPNGYSVSKHIIRKSDRVKGHVVTLPSNNKVFVEDGYSLLVINGELIKCVKTATSALAEIANYAENHNMTPFTVTNTVTGTVSKVEDIQSYSGIIDVKISKNNKAA